MKIDLVAEEGRACERISYDGPVEQLRQQPLAEELAELIEAVAKRSIELAERVSE